MVVAELEREAAVAHYRAIVARQERLWRWSWLLCRSDRRLLRRTRQEAARALRALGEVV